VTTNLQMTVSLTAGNTRHELLPPGMETFVPRSVPGFNVKKKTVG